MTNSVITEARNQFHATIVSSLLTLDADGIPSNADRKNGPSIKIAKSIAEQLGSCATAVKLSGQRAGAGFESICSAFIEACFPKLSHLRPGQWEIGRGDGKRGIARYDQYQHLATLEALAEKHPDIAVALGSDYLIKPDIVVARLPETDETINSTACVVTDDTAKLTPIRQINQQSPILHASISCKWTLRSDRAQNARSEGLNLVRNRKGRLPHVCVIVGEPTPSRISSIALGTGDIDCVYHFALYELVLALKDLKLDESLDLVNTMIDGKRLRDISDLPLDLTI